MIAGSLLTILALLIACLLILRDLAARHRAEEALAQEHNLLSSIINAMPNHVYVKDAKGRFILDNSAHRRSLGLDERARWRGARSSIFSRLRSRRSSTGRPSGHPDAASRCSAQQEQSLSLGGEQRETWLETNKVPLRDTDGKS